MARAENDEKQSGDNNVRKKTMKPFEKALVCDVWCALRNRCGFGSPP
jgi:hypothetical protein